MSRLFKALSAAALSIGLFGGLFSWGYTLSNLDPHTVPVIRKVEGPARVAPKDPGGEIASYQGLSVNEVQSHGTAGDTASRVTLAPSTGDLLSEDVAAGLLIQAVLRAEESQIVSAGIRSDTPQIEPAVLGIEQDKVAALLPETNATDAPIAKIEEPEVVVAPEPPLPADMLRPMARPSSLKTEIVYTQKPKSLKSVDAGTKLVQLGAYDSLEIADVEWKKLTKQHNDLLGGKQQLVQKANSGGRQFYRLRAVGFKNADASRALCSALIARGTACIPVTAR